MGGLFNIAAVFRLVKLDSFTFVALKNKCIGAVIIVFLLCWMNATFSYIAFYIHFDTHLTECQFHRHHGDDCQASCILKEMASEQGLSEQVIALTYAFPVFLFQKKPSFPHALLTGTLVTNHASHYLKHYSPPTLGIQLPPPQYSSQWSVNSNQFQGLLWIGIISI